MREEDIPLTTLAERAWFAFHCLPRRGDGSPPSEHAIEVQYGLSISTFDKLRKNPDINIWCPTLAKLTRALNVSADWLLLGVGERPRLTGQFLVPGSESIVWPTAPAVRSNTARDSGY